MPDRHMLEIIHTAGLQRLLSDSEFQNLVEPKSYDRSPILPNMPVSSPVAHSANAHIGFQPPAGSIVARSVEARTDATAPPLAFPSTTPEALPAKVNATSQISSASPATNVTYGHNVPVAQIYVEPPVAPPADGIPFAHPPQESTNNFYGYIFGGAIAVAAIVAVCLVGGIENAEFD